MAYEHLNRRDRKIMSAIAKQEAARRPAVMTEIPRSRWPAGYESDSRAPILAYESQKFCAQVYRAIPDGLRLSICRVTLRDDGKWEENLSWDELMQVKRECGYGDWYGVEVYPRDRGIVNVANMRHLWLMERPLSIGWFDNKETRE